MQTGKLSKNAILDTFDSKCVALVNNIPASQLSTQNLCKLQINLDKVYLVCSLNNDKCKLCVCFILWTSLQP
jgi:hypothetical protein